MATEFNDRLRDILGPGAKKLRGRTVNIDGEIICENLWYRTDRGDIQVKSNSKNVPVLFDTNGRPVNNYATDDAFMSVRTRNIISGKKPVHLVGWFAYRSARRTALRIKQDDLMEAMMLMLFLGIAVAIIGVLVEHTVPALLTLGTITTLVTALVSAFRKTRRDLLRSIAADLKKRDNFLEGNFQLTDPGTVVVGDGGKRHTAIAQFTVKRPAVPSGYNTKTMLVTPNDYMVMMKRLNF